MSRTVEVTITARVRIPNSWNIKDIHVDRNQQIDMQHFEYDGYTVLETPFQPRVLTIQHSILEEVRR